MKTRKTCKYSRHNCSRLSYRNYRHCYQHILEDKLAPFTSCQYISKTTKRRCHNPALKNEHSFPAFCDFHQQPQVFSQKMKQKLFTQYDDRESTSEMPGYKAEKLQEASGSNRFDSNVKSSDFDVKENSNWNTAVSSSWKSNEADIDADSDDDDDHPLSNAGVYSLEEVVSISQQRLIKLQSLYIKQFNQLRRELQEKRRQYIQNEATSQIKPQHKEKSSKHKDEKQREFASLINYRRHNWENQLLYRSLKRRRLQAMPGSSSSHHEVVSSSKAKCSHVSSHVRCKNSCLPYTKYCISHIFEDPLQVLYKKCSKKLCSAPVCLLSNSSKQSYSGEPGEKIYCSLHQELPALNDDLTSVMDDIKRSVTQLFESNRSSSETNLKDSASSYSTQPSTSSHDKIALTAEDPARMEASAPEVVQTSSHTSQNSTTSDNVEEAMEVEEPPTQDSNSKDISHPETLENASISEKDVQGISRLSSDDLEQLKTGQCFLLNKISVYDETEHRCLPAIHLEPVDTESVEEKSKSISEDQSPADVSETPTSSTEVLTSKEALSSQLHHRGIIMSVEKEDSERNPALNQKIFSVTLVPPVEQNIDQTEANEEVDSSQRNLLLQKMPSLAPLVQESSADDSSRANFEPATTTQDKELDHSLDCEGVESTSPEISPAIEKKFVARTSCKENPVSSVNVQRTGSHSDDSANEICDNKGGDVGEVCSSNERKPSSADEETAIASLLFLSSGTLQNH